MNNQRKISIRMEAPKTKSEHSCNAFIAVCIFVNLSLALLLMMWPGSPARVPRMNIDSNSNHANASLIEPGTRHAAWVKLNERQTDASVVQPGTTHNIQPLQPKPAELAPHVF